MTKDEPNALPESGDSKLGQPIYGPLQIVQSLAGITAVFLIPLVWGAWETNVLINVLGAILAAVAVFTAISLVLHRISPEDSDGDRHH
jgi:hypothetical protein